MGPHYFMSSHFLFCLLILNVLNDLMPTGRGRYYTRQINATGEVSAYPRAANVCVGVQGFITQQYVREGQAVRKNDPIYIIDINKATTSGVVSDNQRREIQNQLQCITDMIIPVMRQDHPGQISTRVIKIY